MKPFTEEDRYLYDLTPDSVVLDCGGYEGRFAAGIHDRYGCTVHVLEPVKHFYDGIVLRFGAEHPKVHVHHFGVGAENEARVFSIKGDMTGAYADNPETERVILRAVDEVVEMLGGPDIDLLKLNVEGEEFPVLEKLLESQMLALVRNIQVQWHSVVPDYQQRFDELQAKLSRTHFLTFNAGWVWQNWRQNGR